jgi:hypothetical protein
MGRRASGQKRKNMELGGIQMPYRDVYERDARVLLVFRLSLYANKEKRR